jgi:peptide/nickel transport system substrate-binding protein
MPTRRALLTSTAAAAAAAVLAPRGARAQARKPVLTIALPSTPETIDPHQFRSVLSGSIINLMGEGLLTRDPYSMELKPVLAESWRNVNPTTWEFKLRRGVKFHNGEDFNADCVKFTVERIVKSKLNTLGKLTWPPAFGQDVQIVDPYTVRFTTKVPDPMVPARFAAESMTMAPARALAEYGERFVTDRFVGTGPYRFVEHVVGDRVVVEANAGYWGAKPPTPRIVWQVIPDAGTRVAALQRGDVDVILNLPLPLVPAVESSPNAMVYAEPSSLVSVVLLNTKESAPLRDRRVRQALNMAIDRPAIIKNLFAGRARLLNGAAGPAVTNGFDPGPYPYDPARAKALLAEAGFPNGFELTFWQSIGRWSQAEEIAQVLAGYWEKIGVRTKLQVLEWAEYNKRAGGSLFKDAFYYSFINATWDASYLLQRFKPSFTAFRYYDASGELLRTLEDYDAAFDPKRRRELGQKAQQGIRDEAAWVFLWQLDELMGISKKVKKFKMRADNFIWARDAYVEA